MSQHDDEEEDRRAILRRRAMFVASALSGIALLDACSRPQPCLSVIPIPPPEVSVPDAPAPDATAALAPEAGMPEPIPCLSVAIPEEPPPDAAAPTPMPCLSVARPRDAGARRDAAPPRVDPSQVPPDPAPMVCLSIAIPRTERHGAPPRKPDDEEA